MAAPKRKKGQIEQDKKLISELFVKGYSLRKIADQICSLRTYNINHTTVKRDLDSVLKDWKTEAINNVEQRQLIEIRKLTEVESKAWQTFEETKSARFLEIVLKCAAQRVQSRTNSRQRLGRPVLDERLASVASEAAGRIWGL